MISFCDCRPGGDTCVMCRETMQKDFEYMVYKRVDKEDNEAEEIEIENQDADN